jgi:quinoprotein glucose dehydrogenase
MTDEKSDQNSCPGFGFAEAAKRFRILPFIVSVMLALVGLALLTGGVWLLRLGGSSYYLLAGLAFLLNSALIYRGSAWIYWAFAILILATLSWALFEVGLDWWQLLPRGNLVAVIGIILILPWIGRFLQLSAEGMVFRSGRLALAGSLIACLVVALVALADTSHDVAGDLPQPRTGAPGFGAGKDWTAYGATNGGDHYSTLDQITPQNVNQLQLAWDFHTGDMRGKDDPDETTYEVTPLKVNDTLYLRSPHDLVFALDAESGREKWRYDPKIRSPPFQTTQHLTCRGVSYSDASAGDVAPTGSPVATDCIKRLFLPTVDGRLIALSAESGKVCQDFGTGGTVDLWQNMPNVSLGSYYSTSPPV